MRKNLCDTQVHDVSELKQHLMKVYHGLRQSVICHAMDEWHKHLWACIRAKGGQLEHLV